MRTCEYRLPAPQQEHNFAAQRQQIRIGHHLRDEVGVPVLPQQPGDVLVALKVFRRELHFRLDMRAPMISSGIRRASCELAPRDARAARGRRHG